MSTDVIFESRMKRKLQQSRVLVSANVGEAASQFTAPSNRITGQGERINFAEEKKTQFPLFAGDYSAAL